MSGADGRLSGKVALVTGGAQGIGEGIVRKFVQHGARVVIGDIQDERGGQLARELGEAAAFQHLDVCDLASWEVAVKGAVERFGRLDILVNNAGGGFAGAIEAETLEQHQRGMTLNVTGVWSGVRTAAPVMAKGGGGSIINISSIDGLAGIGGLSTYVAAKHAVTGLTRSLAIEFGPRGVRVNSVHPGITETPLVKASAGPMSERLAKAIARQPIARIGQPEDVANAVLFFASDESAYCTGAGLVVDGGHLAGPYRDPV